MEESVVWLQGLRVRYYTAGNSGPAVVLLHGGGADSAMLSWRLLIPHLSRDFRVYAPDWPGYGESDNLPGEYSFESLTAWLSDLMDQWGVRQASLVGVSMGGGGAIHFTLTHPERVQKLVLVDSYGFQRKAPFHRLSYWMVRASWLMEWSWALTRRSRWLTRWSLAQIFADARNISESLLDEVFAAVQNPSGQRAFLRFQQREMLPDRVLTCYLDRVGEIRAPTLIIHGDRDRLVPLSDVKEAAQRMPAARLVVIENAGHWPMREQPEKFNRLVSAFLKNTE
ncbi:MAG TPA: alpha/beta hydrolase [Anaerolinea thermolimosa]|uniref:Alpha/beta hydrolase n=1 Tax=Anaerolinea thermolimosa TaxID=229919 RepID=A0A3D1JFP3_9CHLR|nr:alpha/beta hydrolase [Anaerolinea thermolimosa]